MKKLLQLQALMITVSLVIISCQKTDLNPVKPNEESVPAVLQPARYVMVPASEDNPVRTGRIDDCTPTEVTLIAGQTMNAGWVTVTNDADFIYVTYTTTNDWVLTQTHLYVGDCALIPVNNPGNPIPGQFPYSGTHNNLTAYTYQVPISLIPPGSCGCIAAHSVVKQYNSSNQVINQQTAWGNGVRINLTGGNWGMKFDHCSCTPL